MANKENKKKIRKNRVVEEKIIKRMFADFDDRKPSWLKLWF